MIRQYPRNVEEKTLGPGVGFVMKSARKDELHASLLADRRKNSMGRSASLRSGVF
jgi:hypothetical protein